MMTAGSPDPGVSWLNWVIQLQADGRLAGTVQATIDGPVAEIAWVVGTDWQGDGIATEAAQGLVDWLTRQPVRTIIAPLKSLFLVRVEGKQWVVRLEIKGLHGCAGREVHMVLPDSGDTDQQIPAGGREHLRNRRILRRNGLKVPDHTHLLADHKA